MTFPTIFFVGLAQIRFSFNAGRGERFAEDFYITNDRDHIARLIRPYRHEIGSNEFVFLTEQCPNLVYSQGANAGEDALDPGRLASHLALQGLMKTHFLCQSLWMLRDNSGHEDRGWAVVQQRSGQPIIHSNHLNSRVSLADGHKSEVEFSRDELRTAREFVGQADNITLAMSGLATGLTEKQGRSSRFGYFLQCARDTSDVAMKIAQYFSALESLVSSSKTELSHQVSERISWLLEETGERRIAMFGWLKKGYDTRSRAVHGDVFKESKLEHIKDVSVKIDAICRTILYRIYTDADFSAIFELPTKEFDDFFQRLVLNAPPPNTSAGRF